MVDSVLTRLGMSLLRMLPPETAHDLSLQALRRGWVPGVDAAAGGADDAVLHTRFLGLSFDNPVGLAAGFDKNARAIDPLLALGFGFVEVGTVTPKPQPGNPRPRLFRLTEDRAAINRMGFNNRGAAAVAQRVQSWRSAARARPGIVGVNIGKNKETASAMGDYAIGAARFARLADYVTVNLSSPNTPGLRDLQAREAMVELLGHTREALHGDWQRGGGEHLGGSPPPLLLKIAPDLTERMMVDIADVAMNSGLIEGLIICNTTVARPKQMVSRHSGETGGLSGRPLRGLSTALIRNMATLTAGAVPIVGVGGISSGADAYEKIRAGAGLVQLYTALVYEGPGLVQRIKTELAGLLRADGFATVGEAVGVDAD